MVFRVGLTGGIASGKSTVSELFKDLGIEVIDADIIARELSQPGTAQYQLIVEYFGDEIVLADGQLNRPALRKLLFSDAKAKQQLEQILHPAIRQQLLQQAANAKSSYCILSIPLLIEANLQSCVDRILVVDVDSETQMLRLQNRDKLSTKEVTQHLAAQSNRAQRLQYADDIIDNSDAIEKLKFQVTQLHALYCQLAEAAEHESRSKS
ncbi:MULTISPECIES: dephospho-CoA kinase [Methylophaga]|uniref:Dephospho-CoA kinase n=1 Tax=Methylophaga muralis TaxID=291169 RepID=A0A1E3GRA3_9GAMM|nr:MULTISPECIES: dephospho-CoA kinase [Methylophaga]ODN65941.1 Dephospho-CoA kinase [Methylophaga muralis]THK40289.1 dephospho-CoA kinase [Methylophaga sp. SB9B]